MKIRDLVYGVIYKIGKGETFETRTTYKAIYQHFPSECEALGFTPSEPIEEKWKHEIRLALWDAQTDGLIKHIGTAKSGRWQRI
jgi:hypothetical protein